MESPPESNGVLRFDDFTLDVNRGELRRLGELVPLQEKPLQLLSRLIAKPGVLVTREEIRQSLWGADTYVEFDDALNHAVKKLRDALGDSAGSPRFIKTVPRRGYRFVFDTYAGAAESSNGTQESATVSEFNTAEAVDTASSLSRRWAFIGILMLLVSGAAALIPVYLWREPAPPSSLLVLPFSSHGEGPQSTQIGYGISEQVTARLMSLKRLRLVSPEGSFRLNSAGANPVEAGRRLAAEAVLTGSVRISGDRIRVNAQLIRTSDGEILWADGGIEVDANDLLDAERIFAAALAKRLLGALSAEERSQVAKVPTKNAEAYELFLRGKLAMHEVPGERDLRVAEELLAGAVRLDSTFADALAWLGLVQAYRFAQSLADDEVRRTSIENARRAIALDPGVGVARKALIIIYYTTGQALEGLEQASILRKAGRQDADSLSAIATAYFRAGMPDRAVPIYHDAFKKDPEEPSIAESLAFTAYWAGEYDLGLKVLEGQPGECAILPRMNLTWATGRPELTRSIGLQALSDPGSSALTVAMAGFMLKDVGAGDLARRNLRARLPAYERQVARVRNERFRIALGLIYSLLGDGPRARNQARLALEINPGTPWASFYTAAIYAELGDDEQAILHMRQAIERGFLSLQFLDWPHFRLYHLRSRPEMVEMRQNLNSKIGTLRIRY